MSERSVTHSTFVIERTYEVPPARVYGAWADPAAKARWFGGGAEEYELDFRIGGREYNRGGPPDGPVFTYDAHYYDIVPNERIVYSYDLQMGESRISVSLATVEFKSAGTGTRMVFTEQGAFLDGQDDPAVRESGTGQMLEALEAELKRESEAG